MNTTTLKRFGFITLIGASLALAGCASDSSGASTPAAPDKSPAKAAAPATKAPAAKAPVVLLDLTGTGTKQTQKFTAGGDWDLNWTYDCTSFGYAGNFIVMVYNGDGTLSFENTSVNQTGKKGADVQHYHKSGQYYLSILSECNYTIHTTG